MIFQVEDTRETRAGKFIFGPRTVGALVRYQPGDRPHGAPISQSSTAVSFLESEVMSVSILRTLPVARIERSEMRDFDDETY